MKTRALVLLTIRCWRSSFLAASLALALSAALLSSGATVTNLTDADLRAAMAHGGTVTFACDGTISVTNTLTNMFTTVLNATGHSIVLRATNCCYSYFPIFYVPTNSSLTLIGLVISNGTGSYPDGYSSIINDGGTLRLVGAVLRNNISSVSAGGGGALRNLGGDMYATNCLFAGNLAKWITGGQGGAVVNMGGRFTGWNCTFDSNSALGTPDWSSWCCVDGTPGFGGAIYNTGMLDLWGCTVVRNTASGSAGLNGQGSGCDGNQWDGCPGGSGASGLGGALFSSGSARLVNCTIAANLTIGGPGGNGATGFNSGGQPFGGNGGNGGNGGSAQGAIYAANVLTMTNCSLVFNSAQGGSGGAGGAGGTGWPPPHGHDGSPGRSGSAGTAVAGLCAPNAVLVNCIVASNSPAGDTIGNDLGHNLSSESTFTNSSSLNRVDPRLAPLAQNGGPTLTMALLPGSPAIDAGNASSAPAIDQRGLPRPYSVAPDIGAIEFWPTLQASRPVVGGVDILAIGLIGQTCRLWSSLDLVTWSAVATNTLSSSGNALFHEATTTASARFYRADFR